MGETELFIQLHKRLVALRHSENFIALDRGRQLIELMSLCSELLEVDRVSVWQLTDDSQQLSLEVRYDRKRGLSVEAHQVSRCQHQAYFDALLGERIIDAEDACSDWRTVSFLADYLQPQGIVSMLDAPIFDQGALYGAICLESHLPRSWSLESIALVVAIADTISLLNTYEAWQQSQQALDYITHFDDLTGLSNTRALEKRLINLTCGHNKQHESFALAWLNIDKLKQVNQGLGQNVGDQVILAVANHLRHLLVRGKDKIARTGGNEFALIIRSGGQQHSLERTIEELLDQLLKPLLMSEHRVEVTLSAGVCFYPDDGNDSGTLMRHAEIAMHQAKERGHNRARFFNAQVSREARDRFTLERQLRNAIHNNQLTVLYQPIVAASGHQLAGVEALVRWHHPQRGWLSPADFLPLAKASGLMYEVDDTVINQVCADIFTLNQCGINLPYVAINLGAEQVLHPKLAQNVSGLLKRYQILGQQLEFEVTEEVIAHDSHELQQSLQQLVKLGPRLSIDDFGTGYSSLSRLKNLPFSKLKIDRSFVQDLPHDKSSTEITQSIIGLGRGLNMAIVAEGVESDVQARWLLEQGVDYLQGFKFSRAISIEELRSNYLGATALA